MAETERRRASKLPTDVARAIAAAEDKKAEDVVLLDLRATGGFADFFLICSGTNPRQIHAIADAITESLAVEGGRPAHVEGYQGSEWVLLDYFDFIVHIFSPATRQFYSLERLWGNAERVKLPAGSSRA